MTRPSDEILMRYYDGELGADEALEVERCLDAEAARVVAGLDLLGAAVRDAGKRQADAAGDIAGSVLARIEADAAQGRAPVQLARPAARWVAPAAVAALAAAASLALWLGAGSEPDPVARSSPPALVTATQTPTAELPAPPAPEPEPELVEEDVPPAVAIEAVDFGSHNGAIFMVSAGADAEATPVVWLTDEAERTEPL